MKLSGTYGQGSRPYLRCTFRYANDIANIDIGRTLPSAYLLFIDHDPFSRMKTVDTVAYCGDLSQAFIASYIDVLLI